MDTMTTITIIKEGLRNGTMMDERDEEVGETMMTGLEVVEAEAEGVDREGVAGLDVIVIVEADTRLHLISSAIYDSLHFLSQAFCHAYRFERRILLS